MAALTITAANVQLMSSTVAYRLLQAGEAVTQGESVYKAADQKYYLTLNNGTALQAQAAAIALTPAATSEYFLAATSGDIDLGATLTVGETYVVGTVAGTIEPIGDIVGGSLEYVTHLGIASAADTLALDIQISATKKA
jgi:hypothetical protein